VAFLIAQPAALFGLVEGAVVTLFLGAPPAVGAVHVVGFHANIAGLTVPICLAIHRGTFPTAVTVKVSVGRVAVTLLAVFIALLNCACPANISKNTFIHSCVGWLSIFIYRHISSYKLGCI